VRSAIRLTPLAHARQGGGALPAVAVTVARVFPLVHLDSVETEDGGKRSTVRSEAAERRFAADFSVRRERVIADAAAQAQADAERRRRPPPSDSGDAARFEAALLARRAAEDASVALDVQAALESAGLAERNVRPMLKLLVTGFRTQPGLWCGEAVLTLWGASEEFAQDLVEGASFVILNCAVDELREARDAQAPTPPPLPPRGRGPKNSILELSSRGATFLRAGSVAAPNGGKGASALRGLVSGYARRRCVPLSSLLGGEATVPTGAFFDACAVLLHAAPVRGGDGRRQSQILFFTDASLATAADPATPRLLCVELSCWHEGGFLPLAAGKSEFSTLALRHVTLAQPDARHGVLRASASVTSDISLPPAPPQACAQPSERRRLNDELAGAAVQLRSWVQENGEVLRRLRCIAAALTEAPAADAAPVSSGGAAPVAAGRWSSGDEYWAQSGVLEAVDAAEAQARASRAAGGAGETQVLGDTQLVGGTQVL
jgi:hypothetical protein